MLGWTILFALMSVSGVAATMAADPAPLYLKTASILFATLFCIILLTRVVRGRAH